MTVFFALQPKLDWRFLVKLKPPFKISRSTTELCKSIWDMLQASSNTLQLSWYLRELYCYKFNYA